MRILLIEDEDPKFTAVRRFLVEWDGACEISSARSVKSALFAVRQIAPDLMLLDMSLPTFDISGVEPGGRPQGFGGIEVIRYMEAHDLVMPIVVISAYEAFSKDGKDIDLTSLAAELKRDFPLHVKGVVYFNPVQGEWQKELRDLLAKSISPE